MGLTRGSRSNTRFPRLFYDFEGVGQQIEQGCTPNHKCGAHDKNHVHGPGCGHPAVPHGDHVDYLENGNNRLPGQSETDQEGKSMRNVSRGEEI